MTKEQQELDQMIAETLNLYCDCIADNTKKLMLMEEEDRFEDAIIKRNEMDILHMLSVQRFIKVFEGTPIDAEAKLNELRDDVTKYVRETN